MCEAGCCGIERVYKMVRNGVWKSNTSMPFHKYTHYLKCLANAKMIEKNHKSMSLNCFLFLYVLLFIFCLKTFSTLPDDYITSFHVHGHI